MTVAEFLGWEPDDGAGALWQLRDGEPEMMAPASDRHASIQARLAQLIGMHLDANGRLFSGARRAARGRRGRTSPT
jgi:Uma2 family endonuclease